MLHEPKTILSLFDYTGNWARPYHEAGYKVVLVDVKHGTDVLDVTSGWLSRNVGLVHGILAAPPCTDFSVSGSQYWPVKDRDGRTAHSVALVRQTLAIIRFLRPTWWALENPKGRLRSLVPELFEMCPHPYFFDPCDFGGWMRKDESSCPKVEWYPKQDAYTKRTYLWGVFNTPAKKPVEPIIIKDATRGRQYSIIHWKTRESSAHTKEIRSTTPLGMARAFFHANP